MLARADRRKVRAQITPYIANGRTQVHQHQDKFEFTAVRLDVEQNQLVAEIE